MVGEYNYAEGADALVIEMYIVVVGGGIADGSDGGGGGEDLQCGTFVSTWDGWIVKWGDLGGGGIEVQ